MNYTDFVKDNDTTKLPFNRACNILDCSQYSKLKCEFYGTKSGDPVELVNLNHYDVSSKDVSEIVNCVCKCHRGYDGK